MQSRPFSIVGSRPNKESYQYNPGTPLVNQQDQFLRALTTEEMTRLIEIRESAANPGKSNADDIPVFLFFNNNDINKATPPIVSIGSGINKYYARLEAFPKHSDDGRTLSGKYPNTTQALANISFLHALESINSLRTANHPLPMTIVYQIGMNDNHTGTIALRICSFDDPSQNEVMVINSLRNYGAWEDAAIAGISGALQHAATIDANKNKRPTTIKITPETYNDNIAQETNDMNASCAAITAAMSCAISPDSSFADQKENLVNHMQNLTGRANEAALRRDYQQILAFSHPSTPQFNPKAVGRVLDNCERCSNRITTSPVRVTAYQPATTPRLQEGTHADLTPDDFVSLALDDSNLIGDFQKGGGLLYKLCSAVSKEKAINDMFLNDKLMAAIEEERPGNKQALIKKHQYDTTPNGFILRAENDTSLIKSVQEKGKKINKQAVLFNICSKVTDPIAILKMFGNTVLMEAIISEGKESELLDVHLKALSTRQVLHFPFSQKQQPITSNQGKNPANSIKNLYEFQVKGSDTGREHAYMASIPSTKPAGFKGNFEKFKLKYQSLSGDHLKTKILDNFILRVKETHTISALNDLKSELQQSPEYDILKTGQDRFTRFFDFNTSSVNAFNAMFKQQETFINEIAPPKGLPSSRS